MKRWVEKARLSLPVDKKLLPDTEMSTSDIIPRSELGDRNAERRGDPMERVALLHCVGYGLLHATCIS